MSAIRRSRSLARRGLKVQRRVALIQMMFWPALVGTAAAAGVATVVALRRSNSRRPQAPERDVHLSAGAATAGHLDGQSTSAVPQ